MRGLAGLVVALGLLGGTAATAQAADPLRPEISSAVLTIDPDRLFAQTLFGQRVTADIQARTEELDNENQRIAADLTAEEKGLAERRDAMDPAVFRAEADAFDEKVQGIRQAQDAKARALQQSVTTGRDQFLAAVRPILGQVMLSRGASVILDRRSAFLSVSSVDITDAAIAAIDAAIGDGAQLTEPTTTPPQDAPPGDGGN
jgi:Skp family chaperone for outer membrane proteins